MNIGNNYSVVEFVFENGVKCDDYIIAESQPLDNALSKIEEQQRQLKRYYGCNDGGLVYGERVCSNAPYLQGLWYADNYGNVIGVYLKEKTFGISRKVEEMIETAKKVSIKVCL